MDRNLEIEYRAFRSLVRLLINNQLDDQLPTSDLINHLTARTETSDEQKIALAIVLALRNAYVHDDSIKRIPSSSDLLFAANVLLGMVKDNNEALLLNRWVIEYLQSDPHSAFPPIIANESITRIISLEDMKKEGIQHYINQSILILDGKYAFRRAKILGSQGTVFNLKFPSGEQVKLPIERQIGIFSMHHTKEMPLTKISLKWKPPDTSIIYTTIYDLLRTIIDLLGLQISNNISLTTMIDTLISNYFPFKQMALTIALQSLKAMVGSLVVDSPTLIYLYEILTVLTAQRITLLLLNNRSNSDDDMETLTLRMMITTIERWIVRAQRQQVDRSSVILGSLKAFKPSYDLINKKIDIIDGAHAQSKATFVAWRSNNAWVMIDGIDERVSLPKDRIVALTIID